MFNKIAVPDPNPVLQANQGRIQTFSRSPLRFYEEKSKNEKEMIDRCSEADAVIIGWDSRLSACVIDACSNLKYIGLACTLFEGDGSNVDLKTARQRGIRVTGVRDYGDIGVAEWVVSEIIRHLQSRIPRRELAGRKVGVVGAGGAGAPTALALKAMGADIAYFSRSPKIRMGEADIPRKGLSEIFSWADILSLHLPRNTIIGGDELLAHFNGELLINTSLGLPLDPDALIRWLNMEGHYAAFDNGGIGSLGDLKADPKVTFLPAQSGFTQEAEERLIARVIANMGEFLK